MRPNTGQHASKGSTTTMPSNEVEAVPQAGYCTEGTLFQVFDAAMQGCASSDMLVCVPGIDPEGNHCNVTGCGLDTTRSESFGGCATTAGTLCCAN